MREFILALMLVVVCVGLSLGCVIAADHIRASDVIGGTDECHMTWEWLRFGAWGFAAAPFLALVIFVCERDWRRYQDGF